MFARHFLSQQTSQARLPVALLSGFLGSGKTTLINAVLRDPRLANTAVAVNEFGEMPLDGELLEHGADRTLVMANGCLCCNLSGELDQAVMRLFARRAAGEVQPFARLIIEPSGLSDPVPILQAILRNPSMASCLRLEAVVTTVDGCFGRRQLAAHGEARSQVGLADHLLITKPDLAEDVEALRVALRRHNPLAPIDIVAHGAVDAAAIFPVSFLDTQAPSQPLRTALHAEAVDLHLADITSVSLRTDQPLAWPAFEAWLRDIRLGHAEALLRLKAVVDIVGSDGPVALHGVHHVLHAPVQMAGWRDVLRGSRLVFVADAAACAAIARSWDESLPSLHSG